MQSKNQSLILLVCYLFSFSLSIGAENIESTASEIEEAYTMGKIQKELSERQKKIVQFLKSVIKVIKPFALALLSAGGVIAGTEYVWWRLSKYLGSEERKIILFHHDLITENKIDMLELKIARLKAENKLNEHTYRMISEFIALAKKMRVGGQAVVRVALKNQYYALLKEHQVYRETSVENLFPEIEKIIVTL